MNCFSFWHRIQIKYFSREDLLQNIWGSDVYVLARTVDVHIRKVREKIGDDYITTVKGVGYKFSLELTGHYSRLFRYLKQLIVIR